MGFFSFLKYTFIIFAAHLTTSCGAPFQNNWSRLIFLRCSVLTLDEIWAILTEGCLGFPQSLHATVQRCGATYHN
jgi:hypothetical protein